MPKIAVTVPNARLPKIKAMKLYCIRSIQLIEERSS